MDGRAWAPPFLRGGWLLVAWVALTASFVGVPVAALADDGGLHLIWRAPSECPSGTEVQAQIDSLISGRTPGAPARRLDAVSTIARSERGVWTVRLETDLDGARGERVLRGDTCKAVSSATALILALAIDPEAVGRVLAATPPPPGTKEPTATAPPATATVVAVADAAGPAPPWRPQAAALFAGVFAVLPKTAAAARLIVGVERGVLNLELIGLVSQEVRAPAQNRGDVGGAFRLLSAGARLCADVQQTPVVVALCAGATVDRVSATSYGVSNPGSGQLTMLAGLAAVELSRPLTRHLSARIEAGFEVRPYRPRFLLDGVGVVYQTPLLTASAGVGLRLVF